MQTFEWIILLLLRRRALAAARELSAGAGRHE